MSQRPRPDAVVAALPTLSMRQRAHTRADAATLQALLQADALAIDWSRRARATATLVIDTTEPGGLEPSQQRQSSGLLGRPRRNSDLLDDLKASVDTDRPRDVLRISLLPVPAS